LKVGTAADFVIAPLEDVDALVVDDAVTQEYRERLTEAGIEVVVAAERVSVPARGG
jgi:DeoR/GlpR family transcriptional regulator of sugar metabolism